MDDVVKTECSKAYLEHIKGLDARIRAMKGRIDRERELLEGTGYRISERVSVPRGADTMADGAAMLVDMIATFTNELAYYVDEKRQAHELLGLLDDPYGVVLSMHYLDGKRWGDVSRELFYSDRRTYEIVAVALPLLYEHLPEEWRRVLPKAV